MAEIRTFYSKNEDHTYVRNLPVHDIEAVIRSLNRHKMIVHDMPCPPKDFLLKIASFEAIKKYNYKDPTRSEFRQRFGMFFELLLPLGFGETSKDEYEIQRSMAVLIREFVRRVRGEERNLKFVAWYVPKGPIARYIQIYLSDREYLDYERVYYSRDVWHDSKTHQMSSPNNPNAVLVHKKGDFKGTARHTFSSTKSRILANATEEQLQMKSEQFRAIWASVLLKHNLTVKNDHTFKRKKYSRQSNKYLKRIYQKTNWLMTEIENKLAIAMDFEKRDPSWHDIKESGGRSNWIPTKFWHGLESMFFRYKRYFDEMKFTLSDGVKIAINGRCDLAEAALDKLRQKFNEELFELLHPRLITQL